jgi:hypothetical protein
MARPFLTAIDMTLNEIRNALMHPLSSDPGSPTEGQIWYNSTTKKLKYYNGTSNVPLDAEAFTATVHDVRDHSAVASTFGLDEVGAPAGDVSFASHKATNVATPVSDNDAANKAYVDAIAAGARDIKDSVRVATTTAGTLATSFENGDTIDGVVLATGDRILIKNQSTDSQNGIYVVAASGAPSRASDADSSAEVTGGMYVWVNEGTTNGDTGWSLTTNDTITLGSTSLTFTQTSGLGQVTAGAGITKSGNTLDVGAGTGISVGSDSISIDHSVVPEIYATSVGNGSSTSFTVTHNLGTKDVIVQVYQNSSTWDEVVVDIQHTSTSTCTVAFASAPATNAYRVVVFG